MSFFISLGILFLIILTGNVLSRPKEEKASPQTPKLVSIYTIGETPKISYQAKIEKAGVVKIVALSGGVVQSVNVSEGDAVLQGQQIVALSSNYSGGNAPVISSQIANATYKNILDTYDSQKQLIQKQRDIANSVHDNFHDSQVIAQQSATDTTNLINTNQEVLDALNAQLVLDKQNNAPQQTILTEESQINQLQGAQNQLQSGLANLQEQIDESKAPNTLAGRQKDLTNLQLDIQDKALELSKEVGKLQADMANVAAQSMFPTAPFAGIVQRVFVKPGDFVQSGAPLAVVAGNSTTAKAVVNVPGAIAKNMSPLEQATLFIGSYTYLVRPVFVPTEASDGLLFTITYPIPKGAENLISDGEYIFASVPVGKTNTSGAVPFVPLDGVYQTDEGSYLLISQNGKAVAKKVTTGQVFGNVVEITKGLSSGDSVILSRNVVAGDTVQPE